MDGDEPWDSGEEPGNRPNNVGQGYGAGGRGYGGDAKPGVVLLSIQQVTHPCEDDNEHECNEP